MKKFYIDAEVIAEIAGQAHLESVCEQEICEDALCIAKMAIDSRISDAALGVMIRNSLEMALEEEAKYQDEKAAMDERRDDLIERKIDEEALV